MVLQQPEQPPLVRLQPQRPRGPERDEQRPPLLGRQRREVEHRRMDVGRPGDRRRVVQRRGGSLAQLPDRELALRPPGRPERRHGPRPGPEGLGAHPLDPGPLGEVGVDVVRADGVHLAVRPDPGEELTPGQVVDRLEDPVQPPVAQRVLDELAALGPVAEPERPVSERQVTPEQGGRAVGAVPRRVGGRPDPEVQPVEQHRDRGQAEVEVARLALQVALDPRPEAGQRRAELREAPVLRLRAPGAPVRMVAVLLAPGGIEAGRLQVPRRIGADPDLLPGRRDPEPLDALALLRGDGPALRVEIDEPAPPAAPRDAGHVVAHIDEARRAGRHLLGIGQRGTLREGSAATDNPAPALRFPGGRSEHVVGLASSGREVRLCRRTSAVLPR